MKRRSFLRLAGAAALFNIGTGCAAPLAKRLAQGGKIRIALVGSGKRMQNNLVSGFTGEEIVALCDPDPAMRDELKAKLAGIIGAEAVSRIREFFDYREMFATMAGAIDAAVIATPNHHHALPAVTAMRLGIHVYVEKPMASTVEEATLMGRVARETGVVTQVGNQGHSTRTMNLCVAALRSGLIGNVRHAWCYDDRLNSVYTRPPAAPPPKGMDWDLWCGASPVCDYYAPTEDHQGMHPHDWHSWIGYGNGSIGNMGTHIMDAAYWALDLGATGPDWVQTVETQTSCPGAWGWRNTVDYHFAPHGARGEMTLHWYDGVRDGVPYDKAHVNNIGLCLRREYQNLPPALEEAERRFGLTEATRFGRLGTLFEGDKGAIWFWYGSMLRIFPKTLMADVKKLDVPHTFTEHTHEFLAAIRERREANTNFAYSVPLAHAVLLGNVAPLSGTKKLLWNGASVTNDGAADALLRKAYRPGWELS